MEKKTKILIVDDAMFMRKMILKTLNQHGYNDVVLAANGSEGIALYEKERPHIVLLDITMPDMTGLEVLEKILEINKDALIIMCSAVGQDKIITSALRMGAKDFIVKPYQEEMLISMISSLE